MQKIKIVRVTYYRIVKGPIHVVDTNFELQRRMCIVQPLDQFINDWMFTNLKNLDVGDNLTVDVVEMEQKEFDSLREFTLPVF